MVKVEGWRRSSLADNISEFWRHPMDQTQRTGVHCPEAQSRREQRHAAVAARWWPTCAWEWECGACASVRCDGRCGEFGSHMRVWVRPAERVSRASGERPSHWARAGVAECWVWERCEQRRTGGWDDRWGWGIGYCGYGYSQLICVSVMG
jgi:hypothetical protein